MTDDELAAVMKGIAPVVREYVAKTIGDLVPRLAVVESRLELLGDVRDRMVVVETKAATSVLPEVGIDDLRDRLVTLETRSAGPGPADMGLVDVRERLSRVEARVTDDSLTKELGTLRERVAVMEVKGQMPGPPGKDGASGKDGEPGKDGAPGLAGLSFEGVYQDGKSYDIGNLVTWAGSSWHCNAPTTTKPGDGSKDWTLMVKRGRDGKDGAPGADGKPGRDLTTKEAAWRS